jgi:hypothetical protein
VFLDVTRTRLELELVWKHEGAWQRETHKVVIDFEGCVLAAEGIRGSVETRRGEGGDFIADRRVFAVGLEFCGLLVVRAGHGFMGFMIPSMPSRGRGSRGSTGGGSVIAHRVQFRGEDR